MCQRGPSARTEAGLWENPGGEIEPGEESSEAAEREIMEELGVKVKIIKLIYQNEFPADSNSIIWKGFLYEGRIHGQPEIQEPDKCSTIGWFSINQINSLPLASFTYSDFLRLGWLKD